MGAIGSTYTVQFVCVNVLTDVTLNFLEFIKYTFSLTSFMLADAAMISKRENAYGENPTVKGLWLANGTNIRM